jgi:hypothetical protein
VGDITHWWVDPPWWPVVNHGNWSACSKQPNLPLPKVLAVGDWAVYGTSVYIAQQQAMKAKQETIEVQRMALTMMNQPADESPTVDALLMLPILKE